LTINKALPGGNPSIVLSFLKIPHEKKKKNKEKREKTRKRKEKVGLVCLSLYIFQVLMKTL